MTVTTRFLLGRRGQHLYPFRQGPGASSSSPSSSSGQSALPSSVTQTVVGRHSVPPPKRSRSLICKQQLTYGYGFPVPPSPSSSSNYSWMVSPLFLTVSLLLSGCFLGASYLVIRIDRLQAQSMTASTTTVQKLNGRSNPQQGLTRRFGIPLFLNVTLFHIPCEDISVQVTEGDEHPTSFSSSPSLETERLFFKTVEYVPENTDKTDGLPSAFSGGSSSQISMMQVLNIRTPQVQSVRRHRRRLQGQGISSSTGQDRGNILVPSNHNHGSVTHPVLHHQFTKPDTNGCQMHGHLQISLGNQLRPAIVSLHVKRSKNDNRDEDGPLDLSHRIYNLKAGGTPPYDSIMEESMIVQPFTPRTYTSSGTLHRFDVQNNLRLVEHSTEAITSRPKIQFIFAAASS